MGSRDKNVNGYHRTQLWFDCSTAFGVSRRSKIDVEVSELVREEDKSRRRPISGYPTVVREEGLLAQLNSDCRREERERDRQRFDAQKPKERVKERVAQKPKDERVAQKPKDERVAQKPKDERVAQKPKDEEKLRLRLLSFDWENSEEEDTSFERVDKRQGFDPCHFTLNIASNHIYMLEADVDPSALQGFCKRVVDGISGVFFAFKGRPVIRYQRTSDIAKRIAKLMYQQESDFRRTKISPLLLILDRRDDPVTPLLNQWTYQAMVHELIGIEDNKVDLRNIGKSSKDQQEVVLSSEQDAFFEANMYENFGDIGMNIKRMVDDFQQVAKSNQNIQTVEDMAEFVDNHPEYRKMHGNVSKHVTLVREMSKIVEERKLMAVSETEQQLACNGGQGAAFEAVMNLLNNDNVSDIDRLRLVMLYALHYEKESPVQLVQLFNKLASRSPKYKPELVQFLLKQAGVDKRTGDLYGNRDFLNIARNMARGLKGVENIYTQHQPLLLQTMESIIKNRMKDVDYPFVGNHYQQGRPHDVIIFMVGGTTYEESRAVSLLNATNSGVRFILGGSLILNSKRFLKDLEAAQRIAKSSPSVL